MGPSYSILRLCESLIAEGKDVTLAVLDWPPMVSPPRFMKAFPLGAGPRRLGRSPEMHRWLTAEATCASVEIIHNHSLWMMPNVYPGIAAKKHKVPLVVSPRGTLSRWARQSGSMIKRLFWPLVQKPSLAATACFHATAESEYEDIRRMGFRQPVAIIPNGIDLPAVERRPRGAVRTLLFLGRLHPIKGLDILLPAWQAVQDRCPDWRLMIAGPGKEGYLKALQDLTGQLKLKRIQFIGPVKGEEKWEAYQKADLFVLPSYSENFGVAVAEALASGVPAIVSKGAPWKGLEEKKAGWWVDIGVDHLASCLDHAMSQAPNVLAAMGQCGRTWMEEDFSWSRVAGQMTEVYRWIRLGGTQPHCVTRN